MIALGIHPGIANTSYGVVAEKTPGLIELASGTIRTKSDIPVHLRLKKMHDEFVKIIAKYKPDVLLMEESYAHKNVANVLSVGQVRGVMMLVAANAGVDVKNYSSFQVKQAVVGSGKATKNQVQQMVKVLLGLKASPKIDQADALALAICHLHSYKMANFYNLIKVADS